jgi:poly-gamma-glutamate synthesis protein (capsule biosynthesis protein)
MKEKMKVGRREFLIVVLLLLVTALTVYYRSEVFPQSDQISPVLLEEGREFVQTPEKDKRIEIILTGDVMLGRTVMTRSLDEVGDPRYPFRKVDETLAAADLVFINLENPIVSGCPRSYGGFKFCADPAMIEGLVASGVDVVTLANNHSRNYGEDGIRQTKEFLEKNGIAVTGLNNLTMKQFNNLTFGFLGFDFSTESPTDADYELVMDSKPNVDVLIVGIHWSDEYYSEPTEIQRRDAKRLIESGADVIAGHGPHWVQEEEYIDGKLVLYSLGNFVFDQMWSEETRRGLAVKLIFDEKGELSRVEKMPIYMDSWAQPEFVDE